MLGQEKPVSSFLIGLVIVAVFELVILFMYGFFAGYTANTYTTKLEYILTNALAAIGFGLLLIHFRFAVKQTIIVALIVCSVNSQLGPLMQQFWYNVFIQGFYVTTKSQAAASFSLINDTSVIEIRNMSLSFVRISTYCSISLLAALTSVIGKIGILNTLLTTIIFNIGFNLNYYLNYLIYYREGAAAVTFTIMDDFQGSRVFMFGAGFGLALMMLYIIPYPISSSPKTKYSDTFSCFLSLLGTCFILALFYFVLDSYTVLDKARALLNLYFAFSGSIVSSIAICCLINGYISFHQINMAFISGVLQISIIGAFIETPYVSLLVGAFAGIVTSLFLHFVYPLINKKLWVDSKGLFAVYFINCLLCSYFICPIIIKAYKNVKGNINYNEGFHMIYTSISLGVGLFFGFIATALRFGIKQDISFSDKEFFSPAYLKKQIPKQKPAVPPVIIQEVVTQEKLIMNHESIDGPLEIKFDS